MDHPGIDTAALFASIQAAAAAYPAANFTSTLLDTVVKSGGTITITYVSSPVFGALITIAPPSFMPTALPTMKPSKAVVVTEKSSLSAGAIAGIAIGGFVFLVLFFSFVYYLKVKYSKPRIYSELG